MRVTLVGGLLLVLATGGCVGRGGAYPEAASARTEKAQAARRAIAGAQPPPAVKDAAKLVSRSVWGVVPDPPRYKKDLRPGLLRGSAVAVSDRILLANCAAVGRRGQVGLVRHRKYEIAQVSRPNGTERSDICLLTAPGAELQPARAYRPPADIRPGEPVYALVNRTSDDFLLGAGRARRPDGRAAFRADLSLPPRTRSAVLFDARGNLVGLSAGGAGTIAVAGLGPALVPRLAERDLGPAAATLVAFALDRQGGTEPPFFVLEAEPDSDEAPAARQAPGPSRRPTAQDNSTPSSDGRGGQADAGTAASSRATVSVGGDASAAAGGAPGPADPADAGEAAGGRDPGRDKADPGRAPGPGGPGRDGGPGDDGPGDGGPGGGHEGGHGRGGGHGSRD